MISAPHKIMGIQKLNKLISNEAGKIFVLFKNSVNSTVIEYSNGELFAGFDNIFNHIGLYGFSIQQEAKIAIAYVGKAEGGQRIREHLTGKNKNGQTLAKSVNTKFFEIQKAIDNEFKVRICLFSHDALKKPSMACLEQELIIQSQTDFKTIYPQHPHWNQRIG